VQLIGPLPGELASTTVFSAAIGAESKSSAAAKALIEYLTSPQVLPQFKAKGFEPG
jgi:molybdate transport system substrate-binding protein